LNAAQDWFGGAANPNTTGGNLALGQYNAQLDAWARQQQANALSAAGQLGSAYIGRPK
jgi:hypothetical protein